MNVTAPLEATDFVIFGGTGDLALRKLLPALLLRLRDGQLPTRTRVVAVSRAGLDDAGYRDKVRGALPEFVPGVTSGEIDDFAGDVRVLGSYPVAVP